MSSKGSERMRRLAIFSAFAAGAGLLAAAVLSSAPLLGVAGLAAWILVGLAMLLGLRIRAEALLEALAEVRKTNEGAQEVNRRLRESQRRVHDKIGWLNRARREDRTRVIGAVAAMDAEIQKINANSALHDEALDGLRRGLEDHRATMEDLQDLVLRSFRESVESINQLGEHQAGIAALSRQEFERAARQADGLDAAQQHLAERLGRVDEWRSSVDASLASLEKSADTDTKAVHALAGKVSEITDGLGRVDEWRPSVDGVLKALTKSLAHGAEASGALREKMDALDEKTSSLKALEAEVHDIQERIASWSSMLQKMEYGMVQEVEALLHLERMFDIPQSTPLLGGWAMDPMGALAVVKHVLAEKPATVVECGSGSSTVWIAMAMKKNGVGKLISLEHDPAYAAATSDALRSLGLEQLVDIRVAPLEDVELDGETFAWYGTGALEAISGIDMLLVDGPPGATGGMARYPALPLLEHGLSREAVVIMDDAQRRDERRIMEAWQQKWPQLGGQHPLGPRTVSLRWSTGARPDQATR